MLERLGFRHFAYDWRAEHIPTFDAEVEALKRHGVALDAFWVAPGRAEPRVAADPRRAQAARGQGPALGPARPRRRPRPRAPSRSGGSRRRRPSSGRWPRRPAKIGCSLGPLQPRRLVRRAGEPDRHHRAPEGAGRRRTSGSSTTSTTATTTSTASPRSLAKIDAVPAGREPQRHGPAAATRSAGRSCRSARGRSTWTCSGRSATAATAGRSASSATPRTTPRSGSATTSTASTGSSPSSTASPPAPGRRRGRPSPPPPAVEGRGRRPATPSTVAALLAEARAQGDPRRGAEVFASAKFACLSCHKVGGQGGDGRPRPVDRRRLHQARAVVESVLWPRRKVKEGYEAVAVATVDGKVRPGLQAGRDRRGAGPPRRRHGRAGPDRPRPRSRRSATSGTLMPEGLAAAMTPAERRDLVRFLLDLGRPGRPAADAAAPATPTPRPRSPTTATRSDPSTGPSWQHPGQPRPALRLLRQGGRVLRASSRRSRRSCPRSPASTAASYGHWGNQNEDDLGRRPLERDRPRHAALAASSEGRA